MFGFIKRKDNILYSPVKGKVINLENVKDETFSKKILGDGVAFEINDDVVCAPCNGRIELITETSHAFIIRNDFGQQIMIHIGLNTVALKGEGFARERTQGQRIKRGEPIIRIDKDVMEKNNIDLTTMMIITEDNNYEIDVLNMNQEVTVNDKVIIFK